MSLKRLRAHCREMAVAEHKPDCLSLTAKEPWFDPWVVTESDGRGVPTEFAVRVTKPKWEPPKCDGCNPTEDRALFAQIADEIDAHLGDQMVLIGASGEVFVDNNGDPVPQMPQPVWGPTFYA